jgi:iron complex outermembrane receptor protein
VRLQSIVNHLARASASLIVVGSAPLNAVFAQQALPPVVVESPTTRTAPAASSNRRSGSTATRTAKRTRNTSGSGAASAVQSNTAGGSRNLDPRGPIDGYVAQTSMTGTKTNTPLMETPQAISVVGAEQIRDQKPANVAEALRYAPGVGAETFGADTRNDWFKIRGFDAQDVG